MNPQFLHDAHGNVLFAVIPIDQYRSLLGQGQPTLKDEEMQKKIGNTRIKLPYGGPDTWIDALELAEYLQSFGINDIAINQRAQSLEKYPADQRMTLDPILRREFLPEGSPYINTMQATSEVVDALVASGLFRRAKRNYPCFRRAVNSLELIETNIETVKLRKAE